MGNGGGLKIAEPAADLAAAAALISSFGGEALPRDTVFFGEVSLSGDIRPVPQAELRLKEAAKLGFKAAYIPKGTKTDGAGLKLTVLPATWRTFDLAEPRTRAAWKSAWRGSRALKC